MSESSDRFASTENAAEAQNNSERVDEIAHLRQLLVKIFGGLDRLDSQKSVSESAGQMCPSTTEPQRQTNRESSDVRSEAGASHQDELAGATAGDKDPTPVHNSQDTHGRDTTQITQMECAIPGENIERNIAEPTGTLSSSSTWTRAVHLAEELLHVLENNSNTSQQKALDVSVSTSVPSNESDHFHEATVNAEVSQSEEFCSNQVVNDQTHSDASTEQTNRSSQTEDAPAIAENLSTANQLVTALARVEALIRCKHDCDSLLERQSQLVSSLHAQLFHWQNKFRRMQCSIQLANSLIDQLNRGSSENELLVDGSLTSLSQANEVSQSAAASDLVESVSTPQGRKLVIRVSKTYLHLRDLILEKRSLLMEIDKLKGFNTKLEKQLSKQEQRLSSVTAELQHTWGLVSKLKIQHAQLHTAESVLRYELKEKRRILNKLKKDLQGSRERSSHINQLNTDSENAWLAMRKELDERKSASLNSMSVNTASVGNCTDNPTTETCIASADHEANVDTATPAQPSRLENLEQQCVRLYDRLVNTTARQISLNSRLAELHSNSDSPSSEVSGGNGLVSPDTTLQSSTSEIDANSDELTFVEANTMADLQLIGSNHGLISRNDSAPTLPLDDLTPYDDIYRGENDLRTVLSESLDGDYPMNITADANEQLQVVQPIEQEEINLIDYSESLVITDTDSVLASSETFSSLATPADQNSLTSQVTVLHTPESGEMSNQELPVQVDDNGAASIADNQPEFVSNANETGLHLSYVPDLITDGYQHINLSAETSGQQEVENDFGLQDCQLPALSQETRGILQEVSQYLTTSRELNMLCTAQNEIVSALDENTHSEDMTDALDSTCAHLVPSASGETSLPTIGCKLISMLPSRMAHLKKEREQLCERIIQLEGENMRIEQKVRRMRAERNEVKRRGQQETSMKRQLEERIQQLELQVKEQQHKQEHENIQIQESLQHQEPHESFHQSNIANEQDLCCQQQQQMLSEGSPEQQQQQHQTQQFRVDILQSVVTSGSVELSNAEITNETPTNSLAVEGEDSAHDSEEHLPNISKP